MTLEPINSTAREIEGIVESIQFLGIHYEVVVTSGDKQWKIHSAKRLVPFDRIKLYINEADIINF